MKHLLLLFALCLCFSCSAQKLEPVKVYNPQGFMDVLSVQGSTATIISRSTGHSFLVDANDLQQDWNYFFLIETNVKPVPGKTIPATIRFYEVSPEQANKNIKAGLARFKTANPER